ncbi:MULTISPECIES: bifunctional 2-C-methyl-D-erythritol 4-phosphate cytidylyltransferase/2-C-methyl-D-erythritol 2,4-cyclodiphosphate synthase [Rhodomicrobium]|uniref:bifunctional 2-C-methyl-D-erythritol 4-phosphate cytidylyltransferase/2-C-methyl-D-erythritol 2,4-cyclodiphosphate synthase n=1 Tax=Rhodomicrobium TaxID=1068 RepID=UPI000B4B6E56|nr:MULTISPECIES: bifunctional 2-C-methyl-D-erythritol 4-phosphate cytidylyltransferase/2-C-methyl-D-erythritol 2,4-cyclodiphosphate synthase [Rhodomicrobium]
MRNAAIIVAAGRGTRVAGAEMRPKQYLPVGGQAVLARTLAAFLGHEGIDLVQAVIHPGDRALYDEIASALPSPKLLPPVDGGSSRQQSVLAGLDALEERAPDNVLIHDAARPFVPAAAIGRVIESLANSAASLAALPLSDTLKAESNGLVSRTISRAGLWRAQTPQGFRFPAILEAHRVAAAVGRDDFTDDAAIAEWHGMDVALVLGAERNIKLTTMEDFELGERILASEAPLREIRNGTGFDVHAFEPGDQVILCGVSVPHDSKLAGHSDADVGLHALTDALLGAIGAGDIGHHFPPSDPQWKGADSSVFLAHTAKLLAEAGGRIVNVDVTLICERPKIGPYREPMRERVAGILGIDVARVSVKATTTEGLGFTGRREGIAAMASATVELGKA